MQCSISVSLLISLALYFSFPYKVMHLFACSYTQLLRVSGDLLLLLLLFVLPNIYIGVWTCVVECTVDCRIRYFLEANGIEFKNLGSNNFFLGKSVIHVFHVFNPDRAYKGVVKYQIGLFQWLFFFSSFKLSTITIWKWKCSKIAI